MSIAFLFDLGRSRTCPTDARTIKSPDGLISLRYFSIVFALDGDSTIIRFIGVRRSRPQFPREMLVDRLPFGEDSPKASSINNLTGSERTASDGYLSHLQNFDFSRANSEVSSNPKN